jgi:hypothetical protein
VETDSPLAVWKVNMSVTITSDGVELKPFGLPDAEPVILCGEHWSKSGVWAQAIFKAPAIFEQDIEIRPGDQVCYECLAEIIR